LLAVSAEFDLASVDRLLTTTRAVRRRLDLSRPVPTEVIAECLRIAIQAPTGSNSQTWRWVVVADPERRAKLAELYQNPPARREPPTASPQVADTPQQRRVLASARYLTEHIGEVPVLVIPCVAEVGGAAGWAPSIYPAIWSFMLALRSRGLGSCITTVHLFRREEAAQLLRIPEGFVQAAMVPVAYYLGETFRAADRQPVEEVAYLDGWDNPLVTES
jgi:nitroreductase